MVFWVKCHPQLSLNYTFTENCEIWASAGTRNVSVPVKLIHCVPLLNVFWTLTTCCIYTLQETSSVKNEQLWRSGGRDILTFSPIYGPGSKTSDITVMTSLELFLQALESSLQRHDHIIQLSGTPLWPVMWFL